MFSVKFLKSNTKQHKNKLMTTLIEKSCRILFSKLSLDVCKVEVFNLLCNIAGVTVVGDNENSQFSSPPQIQSPTVITTNNFLYITLLNSTK